MDLMIWNTVVFMALALAASISLFARESKVAPSATASESSRCISSMLWPASTSPTVCADSEDAVMAPRSPRTVRLAVAATTPSFCSSHLSASCELLAAWFSRPSSADTCAFSLCTTLLSCMAAKPSAFMSTKSLWYCIASRAVCTTFK